MSEVVKRLQERRAQVWEQAKALADRAADENRAFTAEEEGSWQSLNGELNALDARIKNVLDGEQRAKDTEDAFARLQGRPAEKKAGDEPSPSSELRAWMRGQGGRTMWVPPRGIEQRDLTTAASGVIDTGFRAQLWEYMVETAGVLQAGVDLLETSSGETIKLPRVTAHSAASAATEGSAIDESDPTLGSVNSTVTKQGYVVQLSRELIDDTGVDLQGYLSRSAGRALGNAVGAAAVTAALAAASAGATTAAGTAGGLGAQNTADRGFDYLITLFHSVLAPYRNSSSCSWLMSDPTAAMVRKVKTADGVYAWQPSVVAGQPDTILGKPVYIDTNVPDAAVSVESILFGDWRSLVVRIAGGFRFERSDEFAFNADLVTYRALVRHGSVSVDANALKSLTHAGT
jgi:HK97 family phage major capsid protein